MNDDHIKRFGLSEAQPHRAFQLKAQLGPPVRDKDNAQPVIPPPRTTFNPHPRLAPPGMMGSRLATDAAKWKEQSRTAAETRAEFKPFAPKLRARGQFKMDDLPFKPLVQNPDKPRGPER